MPLRGMFSFIPSFSILVYCVQSRLNEDVDNISPQDVKEDFGVKPRELNAVEHVGLFFSIMLNYCFV